MVFKQHGFSLVCARKTIAILREVNDSHPSQLPHSEEYRRKCPIDGHLGAVEHQGEAGGAVKTAAVTVHLETVLCQRARNGSSVEHCPFDRT